MAQNNLVLDKIKTIAAINILQPVTKLNLSKSLNDKISSHSLPTVLKELVKEGLIINEKKYYRVTRLGMSYIHSRQSRLLRDIYRMKYLLGTSKQRGGD